MYNRLNDKSSRDESRTGDSNTETNELSSTAITAADNYGSTPVQDKPARRCYVPWWGLVFYVMAFLGYFCALLLLEGMNVAIVAMVNHTAVDGDVAMTNVTEDQCPRDPEQRHQDGEFIWDRSQQGVVLASFFYLHGVFQVCSVAYILGRSGLKEVREAGGGMNCTCISAGPSNMSLSKQHSKKHNGVLCSR